MAEQVGVQIGNRFYPLPTSFRLGDPVLVEELTSLAWNEFVERLPDEDAPDDVPEDPVAILGLVGVAVWQGNPTWRRDRVVRYVTGLKMEEVQVIGPEAEKDLPEEEKQEGDERPPATSSETSSEGSAPPSSSGSESGSNGSAIPPSSGAPTSPISPAERSD